MKKNIVAVTYLQQRKGDYNFLIIQSYGSQNLPADQPEFFQECVKEPIAWWKSLIALKKWQVKFDEVPKG